MLTPIDFITVEQSTILYFDFEGLTELAISARFLHGEFSINNASGQNSVVIVNTEPIFTQLFLFNNKENNMFYLEVLPFGQEDSKTLSILEEISLENINLYSNTYDKKTYEMTKGQVILIDNQVLGTRAVHYLVNNDDYKHQSITTVENHYLLTDSINTANVNLISQSRSLGINLSSIVDYSTAFPLTDRFKSARPWITQTQEKWNTKESDKLDLDENGWVKSLTPIDGSTAQYNYVGTLLNWTKEAQAGRYIVLYDGVGTIEYSLGATKDNSASRLGRDIIDTTGKIYLKITSTDPSQTGDYIRNIRVVPEEYENSYQATPINPDYLAKIDDFHSVRFMDWMDTNNSTVSKWSDRNTLDDYTWHRSTVGGVPVEIMVTLANQGEFDPWFTIPHLATDDYVRKFAQYVKDNLEPGRKVYVEYSNEAWNGMFSQGTWIEEQGKAQWSNSSNSNYTKRIDWYSQRTVEIMQIWDQVFGDDKERVIGVMGAQAANIWTGKRALDYRWTNDILSHKQTGIDAIAIAPYFGAYLGSPDNAETVEAWTKEDDGGLNKLFDELTEGGLIKENGGLYESYQQITNYAQLAQQEGLQLIAYEGGQHLVGYSGVENNTAITNLFMAANQDTRMGQIYEEYLNQWYELGGGLFSSFSDIDSSSKWGSWGVLESLYQDSSPKYDALINILEQINQND